MKEMPESNCTSVFVHSADELTEAFTELWTKLINEKEKYESQNVVLQTNVLGL